MAVSGRQLVFVTPEVHGDDLLLRVTTTALDSGVKSTSDVVVITWDEARRLLTNLVAVLNYRHGRLEVEGDGGGGG